MITFLRMCPPNGLRHRPRGGLPERDRGLALRAVALGQAWTMLGRRKNLKLENCVSKPQTPSCQLLSLLSR